MPAGADLQDAGKSRGARDKIPLATLYFEASGLIADKLGTSALFNQHEEFKERCSNPRCPICGDDEVGKESESDSAGMTKKGAQLTCSTIACIHEGKKGKPSAKGVVIDILLVEVIGLRLYTGPLFELCECSTALSFSAFRCVSTALTARFPLPFVR